MEHLEHSGAVQIEVLPDALDELVELRWPRSPQRIEPPGQTSLDARDGGPERVGSLPFSIVRERQRSARITHSSEPQQTVVRADSGQVVALTGIEVQPATSFLPSYDDSVIKVHAIFKSISPRLIIFPCFFDSCLVDISVDIDRFSPRI